MKDRKEKMSESAGRTQRSIRCFIAVCLPPSVNRWFRQYQAGLKKESGIRASWPKPDPLHITLKFLGEIPPEQIPHIQAGMVRAVEQICPGSIELNCSGLGVFPSVKKARVLWAGILGNTDILENLAKELEQQLHVQLGIKREKRRFSPHLTLARVKGNVHPKKIIGLMRKFEDTHSDSFQVSEINLFKSELHASGARHDKIFSVSFKNEQDCWM